jgi:hypothetical protein
MTHVEDVLTQGCFDRVTLEVSAASVLRPPGPQCMLQTQASCLSPNLVARSSAVSL